MKVLLGFSISECREPTGTTNKGTVRVLHGVQVEV